ncbi:MAG: hypothetical protein D3903_10785 [Candidatus Electrothrix sp. GM3_4]|nr:hypothetical protein [Candidatus Electrothrix sp. GM3_4]
MYSDKLMMKSSLRAKGTGILFFQHNLYHGEPYRAIRDSFHNLPRFFFRAKQYNLRYKKKRFLLSNKKHRQASIKISLTRMPVICA